MDRAPCPRPQRGRPAGWAPSSVREILSRPLYRGEIIWNQTQKRDRWGAKRPHRRQESEWLRHVIPNLQIVSDELWQAAHIQLARHREQYLSAVAGRPLGSGTKYLLSGLLECGRCHAGIEARTRAHGGQRVMFYGCSAFHRRGAAVCGNRQTARGDLAEGAIVDSVKRGLLNPAVLAAAIREATVRLAGTPVRDAHALLQELTQVNLELTRLSAAIAGGHDYSSLLTAICRREDQRAALEAELESVKRTASSDVDEVDIEEELTARVQQWREVLTENPGEGKNLLRQLIVGRITLLPGEDGYRFRGVGTVQPLLAGILPHNLASLTIPTWNQIAGFLESMRRLRDSAGFAA